MPRGHRAGGVTGGGYKQGSARTMRHGSGMGIDPVVVLAARINAALDPNQEAPRRFVPKRKPKSRPAQLPALMSLDGRVLTEKFKGFTVVDLIQDGLWGESWARWMLQRDELDGFTKIPPMVRRKMLLVLAAQKAKVPKPTGE